MKKCAKCGNKELQTTTTYHRGVQVPCLLCVECGEEYTPAGKSMHAPKPPPKPRKA